MSAEPIVPASPSTVGLTSDEALLLRDELRAAELRLLANLQTFRHEGIAGRKSIRDDILGVSDAVGDVAKRQHQLSDSILAVLRQVQVNEMQRTEATRRAEAHAKMTEERLSFIVRRLERDHDTLSDVRSKVPDEEIVPWFRRAWRPVLVLSALAMLGGALGGCLSVRMMNSTPDAVDASRPAPSFSFTDRQP